MMTIMATGSRMNKISGRFIFAHNRRDRGTPSAGAATCAKMDVSLPQCGQNSVRFIPSVSNTFQQCWHLALINILLVMVRPPFDYIRFMYETIGNLNNSRQKYEWR